MVSEPTRLGVAVLMGGPSREHDVSLQSGAAVAAALREAGCQVFEVPFDTPTLPPLPDGTDVVFPALHGRFGEDGQIQALLEAEGWPYVGCGPVASQLIIDKCATKEALRQRGIPTPAGQVFTTPDAPLPAHLPVIVKPSHEGSTIGLTLVRETKEWESALAAALECGDPVLVEEYVEGVEITVGLLDGEALPVVEIVPPNGLFDYDAKYVYRRGKTHYHCPPKHVSQAAQQQAREFGATAFSALRARDLLRVDMIVPADGRPPTVLEANSMPGFTATSLLPKAARVSGLAFPELCLKLVHAAWQRGQSSH
jgi:D-alanine-D-alanine ligase